MTRSLNKDYYCICCQIMPNTEAGVSLTRKAGVCTCNTCYIRGSGHKKWLWLAAMP